MRRLDLIVFVVLLSLAVPLLLAIPGRVARIWSDRVASLIHAAMFGLLAGLIVWALLQPGLDSYLAGSIVAVAAGVLRFKTSFGRNFAAILTVATPVTILLFFASYPISSAMLPGESGAPAGHTEVDTPVVLVSLDEFPLATLLNRNDRIDARFFPTFAELERRATWYRQATSLTDHTLSALPSILTGEDPKAESTFGEPTPPGYPAYPDSVCSVAERAGYETWSSQIETDLCGRSDGIKTRLSRLLMQGIPRHYPDSVNDLLGGNLNVDQMTPGRIFERAVESLTNDTEKPSAAWDVHRDDLFMDFVDGMPERPRTISFLHSLLPHAEYQYLPDGTTYTDRNLLDGATVANFSRPANWRESAKNLQQLTAQTMYTDRLLGRLIARLKKSGTWDETLFVVVADHGASFVPGTGRRTLSAESSGWMLPVPLFVKYPGQSHGQISDAAADIRDVTPTILDVLGLEPSPDATGVSLKESSPPATKVIGGVDSAGNRIELTRRLVERKRREAIRFRNRALGDGLYALGAHPDLIGRPVSKLAVGKPLAFEPMDGLGFDQASHDFGVPPVYFQATLTGVSEDPGPLAIAVDGRVVATARAWPRGGTWMTGVNLPLQKDATGIPEVTIFPIGN